MMGTIRTKIIFGFGLTIVLVIVMGLYVLSRIGETNEYTLRVASRDTTVLKMAGNIAREQEKMRALYYDTLSTYLLHKSEPIPSQEYTLPQGQWRQTKEYLSSLIRELQSQTMEYAKSAHTTQRQALWEKACQKSKETDDTLKEIVALIELHFKHMSNGNVDQLVAGAQQLQRMRQDFDAKTESISQTIDEILRLGEATVSDIQDNTETAMIVGLVLVVLLGGFFSIVIVRSIVRPLDAFMKFVERVGQGDLTQQASATSEDELGKLGQNLNQMVVGLKDVASQTRAATENLNSAAAEIVAATQQQSAGMQEQAGAVQETTSTMEEINQTGTQISEKARQVATMAEATSSTSTAGLQSVQNTTKMMEALREQAEAVAENIVTLSEKTQAIGDIIATVTDIAEQSNLLALNAAIEAAAAGEHGRSFSIVANEIKNLADQAKTSTVQVRTILGEIQKGINSSVMLTEEAVKRAESGKQQADITEQTIRQMSANIQQSVQAFQQIVAAQNQQQIGFEQVTQALKNIRQTTEQTVSSTRQMEKAAANLNALGQQLLKSVERYRV